MSRRKLDIRRAKNRELAAEDAKHRCAHCRAPLPKTGVQMLWGDPRLFCSDVCLEDFTAAGKSKMTRTGR